jgi:capsular exopolysaccharide synthesis family protein
MEHPSADDQAATPLYSGTTVYGGAYGMPPAGVALLDPRRLLRNWRTLTLVMVFAIASALGYLWTATKVYRSDSLIELSVRRPRILTQQAAVIEDQSSQSTEVFNTRLERFRSRTMFCAALARLDQTHPDAFRPPASRLFAPAPSAATNAVALQDARLRRLERSIDVVLIRRSRLIRVACEHADPTLAAAACNAFAEAVEVSVFDENRKISDAAVVWLEAQADAQRKELLKAEDVLLEFRQKNQIDALESQRKTVEDAMLGFNRELVRVEGLEAEKRALLAKIDQLKLDPERSGELPADIPSIAEISAALEQWRLATVERASLLATLTPKHPEIQVCDKGIAVRREHALQALARLKTTAHADHELLVEQTQTLRRKLDAQAERAVGLEKEIVERKTRLAMLERTRDAADQSFRGILTRIQEARTAADENTATVKIVEKAVVPTKPVKPQPLRVLAVALLLGLVSGIGLIVVCDRLQDRVSTPEDLVAPGIPVLAVVPHVKSADRAAIATATTREQFAEVVEAFAGLGAVLDSPRHKARNQVVLVVSSMPVEGKTVTSCNLAGTLARRDRRVLLVDFDLRRPQLAGIFPPPVGYTGLIEALSHAPSEFEPLCYPAEGCPNLEVIASRPARGLSPVQVMGTPAVGALLAWARKKYDHVVVDAAPLGLVSDVLTLAPYADLTLVMVRSDVSRKRLIRHTLHRLLEAGVHNVAIVFNDMDISKRRYGSYSPYYHYRKHYESYGEVGNRGQAAG